MTIPETILTIEVRDNGALALLRDMERLNLIHVSPPGQKQRGGKARGSLSERFVGALRLSAGRYEKIQTALRKGRDEWDRNIF